MYEGAEAIGNCGNREQIITVGPLSFILALFVYTVLHVHVILKVLTVKSDYLLFKLNVYKSI